MVYGLRLYFSKRQKSKAKSIQEAISSIHIFGVFNWNASKLQVHSVHFYNFNVLCRKDTMLQLEIVLVLAPRKNLHFKLTYGMGVPIASLSFWRFIVK